MTGTIPPSACPSCRTVMDDATGLEDADRPSPGDVAVCFYCAAVLVYDDELALAEPDPELRAHLETHPQVVPARRAIQRRLGAPWS